MDKITEDTTLSAVLKDSKAGEVLAKYDFPCLTCPFGRDEMETLKIGDVCKMYGIDVKKLVNDLNEIYKK